MTSKVANKKLKWSLDFNTKAKNSDISSPPGYNISIGQSQSEITKENDQNQTLIIKKSWEIALGAIKQVPMNLLIMYMSGNSISIFPIMMVGMMLIRPIKAIFSTSTTFKVIDGNHASGQKFVYVLGHVANLALAIYKCHSMGLLPTHSSDWLAFVESQSRMEYFGGGMSFL